MAGQGDRGGTFRIPRRKKRGFCHNQGKGDIPHWKGTGRLDSQHVGAGGR